MKKIVCLATITIPMLLSVVVIGGCDNSETRYAEPKAETFMGKTQAEWELLAKEEELAEQLWNAYLKQTDPALKREIKAHLEQYRDKGFVVNGQPLRVLLDKY